MLEKIGVFGGDKCLDQLFRYARDRHDNAAFLVELGDHRAVVAEYTGDDRRSVVGERVDPGQRLGYVKIGAERHQNSQQQAEQAETEDHPGQDGKQGFFWFVVLLWHKTSVERSLNCLGQVLVEEELLP